MAPNIDIDTHGKESSHPYEFILVDLSSLQKIFSTPIFVKDLLAAELWPMVRTEYRKLVREVIVADHRDMVILEYRALAERIGAFDIPQKYHPIESERAEARPSSCFHAGTSRSLESWRIVMISQSCSIKWRSLGSREKIEVEDRRLVALGRPAQILKRLVSPGLAEYNEYIRQKLLTFVVLVSAPKSVNEDKRYL